MLNTTNKTHDAEKVASDLRDNLAQHDKPISFFFGAGTSSSVEKSDSQALIPTVRELTSYCKNETITKNKKFEKAWSIIEDECENIGQEVNIEYVLSRLRMSLQVIGNEKLLGLNKNEIIDLEKCIRNKIAERVSPDLQSQFKKFPHRKFSKWLIKSSRKWPVEIFTLNYDVLLEFALEIEQAPFFDGFIGSYQAFFNAESLHRPDSGPGVHWTRLWKMHGSVNWRKTKIDGSFRLMRGDLSHDGEMIYPSLQKYDESKQQPYSAFADCLRRFLNKDDSLLIVCGYSFGDEHINQIMFGALENNPRTHIYALQFEDSVKGDTLYNYATKLPNLVVIGPSTGIIGCQHLNWKLFQPPAHLSNIMVLSGYENVQDELDDLKNSNTENKSIENNEVEAMIKTEYDTHSENVDTNENLKMTIGDFNSFCDFLDDMAYDYSTKG